MLKIHIQKVRLTLFSLSVLDAEKLVGLDNEAQNLVNCLQVLEVLTPAAYVELLSKVHATSFAKIFVRILLTDAQEII